MLKKMKEIVSEIHVRYGLIMCAVLVVCLVLMELTGQNQAFDSKSPFQMIFMFIAPAVVWFYGIREKKRQLKGNLTFKQGLTQGFKISLVYAIVSPFIFMLYYLLINPSILSYVRTAYTMPSASDGLIIGVDMLTQFISAIIFGTIYAAIISLFLKSKSS